MSRQCSVCGDPRLQAIDAMLASGRAVRRVALALGLSYDALIRHARRHVGHPAMVGRIEREPGVDSLTELVAALRERALEGNDPSIAREYRLALAAQADRGTEPADHNVLTDPEWLQLRAILLEATGPFAEAHRAVAQALHESLA